MEGTKKLLIGLLAAVIPLSVFILPAEAETASKTARNANLPNVAIVAMGGTIAEATDPKTGADIPTLSGDTLIAAVPGLAKIANINVVNFSNIDSSQMTPG